jgi:hypothetical protein
LRRAGFVRRRKRLETESERGRENKLKLSQNSQLTDVAPHHLQRQAGLLVALDDLAQGVDGVVAPPEGGRKRERREREGVGTNEGEREGE